MFIDIFFSSFFLKYAWWTKYVSEGLRFYPSEFGKSCLVVLSSFGKSCLSSQQVLSKCKLGEAPRGDKPLSIKKKQSMYVLYNIFKASQLNCKMKKRGLSTVLMVFTCNFFLQQFTETLNRSWINFLMHLIWPFKIEIRPPFLGATFLNALYLAF